MSRCSCGTPTCFCLVEAGEGVSVSGTGSPDPYNPYVVSVNVCDSDIIFIDENNCICIDEDAIGGGAPPCPAHPDTGCPNAIVDCGDGSPFLPKTEGFSLTECLPFQSPAPTLPFDADYQVMPGSEMCLNWVNNDPCGRTFCGTVTFEGSGQFVRLAAPARIWWIQEISFDGGGTWTQIHGWNSETPAGSGTTSHDFPNASWLETGYTIPPGGSVSVCQRTVYRWRENGAITQHNTSAQYIKLEGVLKAS